MMNWVTRVASRNVPTARDEQHLGWLQPTPLDRATRSALLYGALNLDPVTGLMRRSAPADEIPWLVIRFGSRASGRRLSMVAQTGNRRPARDVGTMTLSYTQSLVGGEGSWVLGRPISAFRRN